MTSIREEIAKNLLYYRKKKNLTQKGLAELLGVTSAAVSNWENGVNSVDIDTLYKACSVLGVTFNDMYGIYARDLTGDFTPHERALIDAYRVSPELQIAVDKLLGVPREGALRNKNEIRVQEPEDSNTE